MARPRKSMALQTRNNTKKERADRVKAEQKLKCDRNAIEETPDWLDENARAEFERIVTEAGSIGILDNLDLAALAVYASSFSQYQDACEKVRRYGMLAKSGKDGKGVAVSPYINILDKAAARIMQCSIRLGLSTTDRLKLLVPAPEEKEKENKFMRFLKNA